MIWSMHAPCLHAEVRGDDLHRRRVDRRAPGEEEKVAPPDRARDERLLTADGKLADDDTLGHVTLLPRFWKNRSYGMPDDRTEHVSHRRDARRPASRRHRSCSRRTTSSALEVDGVAWEFLAEDARPLRPGAARGTRRALPLLRAARREQPGGRRAPRRRSRGTASGSTSSTSRRARRTGSPSRSRPRA